MEGESKQAFRLTSELIVRPILRTFDTKIDKIDGMSEIILGVNPGATPHVRVFDRLGNLIESFYAWEAGFAGGVNPGIIKINNK